MNQTNLPTTLEGNPSTRITKAIAHLKAGGGVLVLDDEDRENEGDLIYAAETMTPEQMAFMIRECSGIVCLALTDEKINALQLPQMVSDNTSSMGTAFTVSIEAKEGVTTGVSARDRITTIQTAIAPEAAPTDLAKPGHIFPLKAHPEGLSARPGHTEASVELAKLAGFQPAAVLCEVTKPDGTMARTSDIIEFGVKHDLPVVTIEDLLSAQKTRLAFAAA